MLDVLSARTDLCYIYDAPPRECRGSQGALQALAMTPQPDAVRKKPCKDSAVAVQKGLAMISVRRQRRQLASRVSAAPQPAQTTFPPSSVLARLCTPQERPCERQFDRGEAHLLQSTKRKTQPSDLDVREAFARKGMDDTKTVALIERGHAFGKIHGTTCPWKRVPPSRLALDSWAGACGTTVR